MNITKEILSEKTGQRDLSTATQTMHTYCTDDCRRCVGNGHGESNTDSPLLMSL